MQGYNNVIVYSRAFYFCVISLLIIIVDVCVTEYKGLEFSLYGVNLISSYLLVYARELLKGKQNYIKSQDKNFFSDLS